MQNKKMLHIVNWGLWGGVQTVALSIAREFREYDNYVLTYLDKKYRPETADLFVRNGVTYLRDLSIIEAVEKVKPDICFLHNTVVSSLKGLPKCRYVRVHHGWNIGKWDDATDWYVSYSVLERLNTFGLVLPPVLNVSDFNGEVKLPKDPIVGKVQSLTKAGDPTPADYYEIAKGYRQFIVGLGQKTHAPFRAGLAADYLRAVDVMLLYQDKIETWGLSLSEANLMGIPAIIKDNNDGMSEQARKSGGALVVNDAKEARDALQELLNNEKLYIETATNGQNWCRRNMDASLLRKYL